MNLQRVSLKSNKICNIGLRLFANSSDLQNLRNIELNSNLLSTIEPWPFIRASAATVDTNTDVTVTVDVSLNAIKMFTNAIGWRAIGCYSSALSRTVYRGMNLDMSFNQIDHYSTLLEALQFDSMINYQCWASKLNLNLRQNYFDCDCLDFHMFAYSYRYNTLHY